jgi:hypothetical protein
MTAGNRLSHISTNAEEGAAGMMALLVSDIAKIWGDFN